MLDVSKNPHATTYNNTFSKNKYGEECYITFPADCNLDCKLPLILKFGKKIN